MKLFFLGSLALLVAKAMAQSEGCISEFEKYNSCLSGIKIEEISSDEAELNKLCNTFNEDKCKDFIADAGKTESACDPKTDKNDQALAAILYTMKIAYLTYCVKDSKGNLCPTTSYIIDNAAKENVDDKVDEETKKAFIDDCNIPECNTRLINLVDITKKFSELTGSNDISNSEFEKFVDIYKNKKCDDINNIDDGSTGSAEKDSNSGIENAKKFSYIFGAIIFLIVLALLPNSNVDIVSSRLNGCGLQAIRSVVLLLPPKLSYKIRVNLLFLYGMCPPLAPPPSANILMH